MAVSEMAAQRNAHGPRMTQEMQRLCVLAMASAIWMIRVKPSANAKSCLVGMPAARSTLPRFKTLSAVGTVNARHHQVEWAPEPAHVGKTGWELHAISVVQREKMRQHAPHMASAR